MSDIKKQLTGNTILTIAAPLIVAAIVFLFGLPAFQAKVDGKFEMLNNSIKQNHDDTVNVLNAHGTKIDKLSDAVSHIQGELHSSVVRTKTADELIEDDNTNGAPKPK